jgi:glycosyltransferase involved in cell wall biosynthesis
LVRDGSDGIITRALDVGDFAQAIRRLVKNLALRKKMGENARLKVKDLNWGNAFHEFWNATLYR